MPIINVDITWSKNGHNEISLKNGQIIIENGEIWLKGQMSSSEWRVFSRAYPANIDLWTDFKNCIKLNNAILDGERVKVNLDSSYVYHSYSIHYQKGYADLSFRLTDFSYSYKCGDEESFAILDVPFMHLSNHIQGLNRYPEDIILTNGSYTYRLCNYDDDKTKLLGQVENDDYMDALLVHMSFFFNLLPNVFIKSFNLEGVMYVCCHSHKFSFPNESLYHSELPYLTFGECHDFDYFFKNSKWMELGNDKKNIMKNTIYTFARCKYCDDVTQFLLLYSIFDRLVGNKSYNSKSMNTYNRMGNNLLNYNIDIARIGDKIDKNLQKLQLKLERNNGKEVVVDNFCMLRHYILHFMSNAVVDEFISRCNLIDNMRFAVTIIILKDLGFNNIKFRKEWDYLSVLIET